MANQQLTLTGKFLGAGKIEEKGATNFLIRKFWLDITDNPQYPNTPEFQLTGDKVSLVDNLTKGQEIVVKFNIDGRRYKNSQTNRESIITNLSAWRIEVVQRQSAVNAAASAAAPRQTAPAQPPQAQRPTMPAQPFGTMGDDDDLPF